MTTPRPNCETVARGNTTYTGKAIAELHAAQTETEKRLAELERIVTAQGDQIVTVAASHADLAEASADASTPTPPAKVFVAEEGDKWTIGDGSTVVLLRAGSPHEVFGMSGFRGYSDGFALKYGHGDCPTRIAHGLLRSWGWTVTTKEKPCTSATATDSPADKAIPATGAASGPSAAAVADDAMRERAVSACRARGNIYTYKEVGDFVADFAASELATVTRERDALLAEFKNFHRLLCNRFGIHHDEVHWKRDQLSLIEHIAVRAKIEGSTPNA